MAEKEIGFKVQVDTSNATKTLGELEQDFERLNEEIKKVPINSKEFKELNTQLAQTGREIKNVELGFESLDNEQVASELGSVAGAVGDVSAAFILLGDDSETMQEVAKNIELAMGVSMGLKGAIEGVSSANKLLNNSTLVSNTLTKINAFIKGESAVASTSLAAGETARATATAGATTATSISTGALKLFRIALISTGIGAIIVGLGLLIANFESVSKWIRKVADDIYNIFKPQIDIVIGALQYLGIVEDEQTKKSREASKEKARAYKQMVNQVAQELEREVKLQRKLTEEKIADMDYEIAKRQAMGEDTVEIEREKIVELMKLAKMELALTEEKIKAKQKELEATKGINSILIEGEIALYKKIAEEQGKSLKEIEQQLEIHDIKVRKSHMDEVKARQEANSKLSEEQKKEIAEREKNLKIKENLLNREFEAERKTAENIKGVRNNLATFDMDLYKKQNDLRVSLMEDGLKKELQLSQNAFLDRLATLEKEGILTNELKTKLFEEQAQREADIQKQFQQEEFNQRLQGAQDLSGALSDLNNAKLEADLQAANGNEREMEKIRKKAFARQKALDIVQATISGIKAVQSALTAPPPLGFALAGIVGATALANIKKIASTQFQGSGGGGSAPSSLGATASAINGADVGTVTNTSTVLGGDTKVFVTEQDISNTQNKVEVVESEATL